MSIISVDHLSRTFFVRPRSSGFGASVRSFFSPKKETVLAVKELSFKIEEGEFVGFLGPNGAGKTTTLKMLSGILHPSAGDASVLGCRPWERKREFQKRFALVMGQKQQLWWDLPPMNSFALNKEIYEIPSRQFSQTLDELVELLDIGHVLHTPVRQLSLGERMKCELAAALLHRPEVLFLDEPTIGLDVVSRANMHAFLKKYNAEKKITIILTSHYMGDVEELCERLILINHGSLMFDGGLRTFLSERVRHKQIRLRSSRVFTKKELETFGVVKEASNGFAELIVEKPRVNDVTKVLLKSFDIEDISITELDLEDVIRELFTPHLR